MEYPWSVIKKAHSVGLLNCHIPEAYGGSGLGVMSSALISEELAYGCTGIQTAMEANGLAEGLSFLLHISRDKLDLRLFYLLYFA